MVMGPRCGNLVMSNKKPDQETHYHDKLYHKRFERSADQTAARYQPGTFTFYVDARERRAVAQPRRYFSGLEGARPIGCGHTSSLGGFSARGLADRATAEGVGGNMSKRCQIGSPGATKAICP